MTGQPDRPTQATAPPSAEDVASDGKGQALFSEADADDLQQRWRGVQTAFVDEPRAAVEQADALVAEVMQRLTDGFARERAGLERQWSGGQDVSTEELRLAIRRYRSFFDRLLSL